MFLKFFVHVISKGRHFNIDSKEQFSNEGNLNIDTFEESVTHPISKQ